MTKTLLLAASLVAATYAHAQTAKIVGIGASTCARFNEEIARSPRTERDYFAWAQSFMSGVLMRAPQGVDEAPRSFPAVAPLQTQAAFLRNFCSRNPTDDAVLALYLRLRKMETNARQNALERTNLCRSSTITGLRRIVPNTS